jgi:fatty acid desaturase
MPRIPVDASPAGESMLTGLRSSVAAQPAIMAVRNSSFVRKLLEQLAMIGCGAYLALTVHSLWLRLAGVALLGAAFARNLELLHECMHFSALRSRRANRVCGALLGLPMLISFEEWRQSHLRHHADVRTEFTFSFDSIDGFWQLLRCWLMLGHYREACVKMVRSLRNGVAAQKSARTAVNREYRLMAALITAAVIVTIVLHTRAVVWLWLLPLVVASVVNFHIQLPEHYQCDMSSNDALRNTRTIRASRAAAWFVNNNNFHTSHHWMPAVPIARLRQLDGEMRRYVPPPQETYPQFFGNYYLRLWKNFHAT